MSAAAPTAFCTATEPDEVWFNRVFTENAEKLVDIVRWQLPRVMKQDAEDVVQRLYVRLYPRSGEIHSRERNAISLLRVAARNEAKNWVRDQGKRQPVSAELPEPASPEVDPEYSAEDIARLELELNALSEKDRELLRLIYQEGMSQAGAARTLGITVTTAKRQHERTRQVLRERIENDKKRRGSIDARATASTVVASGAAVAGAKSYGWMKTNVIIGAVLVAFSCVFIGGYMLNLRNRQPEANQPAASTKTYPPVSDSFAHEKNDTADAKALGVTVGKKGDHHYWEKGNCTVTPSSIDKTTLSNGDQGYKITVTVQAKSEYHVLRYRGVGGLGRDEDQKMTATEARIVYEGLPGGVREVESSTEPTDALERELWLKVKQVTRKTVEDSLAGWISGE